MAVNVPGDDRSWFQRKKDAIKDRLEGESEEWAVLSTHNEDGSKKSFREVLSDVSPYTDTDRDGYWHQGLHQDDHGTEINTLVEHVEETDLGAALLDAAEQVTIDTLWTTLNVMYQVLLGFPALVGMSFLNTKERNRDPLLRTKLTGYNDKYNPYGVIQLAGGSTSYRFGNTLDPLEGTTELYNFSTVSWNLGYNDIYDFGVEIP